MSDPKLLFFIASAGAVSGGGEPLEFFETRGEVEIDLDAGSWLPLRVAGDIGGFGRVDFVLSEVAWRP